MKTVTGGTSEVFKKKYKKIPQNSKRKIMYGNLHGIEAGQSVINACLMQNFDTFSVKFSVFKNFTTAL